MDTDGQLRPRRPLRNLCLDYRPRVRLHQGTEEHAIARHERVPLHVSYLQRTRRGLRATSQRPLARMELRCRSRLIWRFWYHLLVPV